MVAGPTQPPTSSSVSLDSGVAVCQQAEETSFLPATRYCQQLVLCGLSEHIGGFGSRHFLMQLAENLV